MQWTFVFIICFLLPNGEQLFPLYVFVFQVIKLWDLETGTAIFEYGDAHGDSAITCMTFDNTGRR